MSYNPTHNVYTPYRNDVEQLSKLSQNVVNMLTMHCGLGLGCHGALGFCVYKHTFTRVMFPP